MVPSMARVADDDDDGAEAECGPADEPPAHIGTLEDRKPLGARRDGTDGKECSDDTVRLDERQGLAKG
jgi:hypothetical protein